MPKKTDAEIAALLNRCVLLRLKANAMMQNAEKMARQIENEKERQQNHRDGHGPKLETDRESGAAGAN